MIALTISTYTVGKLGYGSTGAVLFILLTAVIKGSLIIRDFMELRGVSLLWRVIMYGWLWVTCAVIAISYIVSL
jgi:hypothetical protein